MTLWGNKCCFLLSRLTRSNQKYSFLKFFLCVSPPPSETGPGCVLVACGASSPGRGGFLLPLPPKPPSFHLLFGKRVRDQRFKERRSILPALSLSRSFEH